MVHVYRLLAGAGTLAAIGIVFGILIAFFDWMESGHPAERFNPPDWVYSIGGILVLIGTIYGLGYFVLP